LFAFAFKIVSPVFCALLHTFPNLSLLPDLLSFSAACLLGCLVAYVATSASLHSFWRREEKLSLVNRLVSSRKIARLNPYWDLSCRPQKLKNKRHVKGTEACNRLTHDCCATFQANLVRLSDRTLINVTTHVLVNDQEIRVL